MSNTVTQAQAERVLAKVAEWLGVKKRHGPWLCKDGRELDNLARHINDGTPCSNGHYGACPTGPEAASHGHGLGPELVMDWSWPGEPTPTILLEGGPYDWAIEAAYEVRGTGCFLEPYAGYALCIYPS